MDIIKELRMRKKGIKEEVHGKKARQKEVRRRKGTEE
jgi:hypothetical protein